MPRLTPSDIKKTATPLVVLTCYTAPMARLLDGQVEILLVGDSLGMVLYGMESTRGVTLDMMIAHGRAVVGASQKALVVVDMPFGTCGTPAQALEHSRRLLEQTGAGAVKIEGGAEMTATIRLLVDHHIPVMGHIGLLPQSAESYRYQGRTPEDAQRLQRDALAVQAAGAFAVVIEAVKETVAREITAELSIPTIGIGASPACDGQVLVSEDMLGLSGGYIPGFVKLYASLASEVEHAVKAYAQEVRTRAFPAPDYCYPQKKEP